MGCGRSSPILSHHRACVGTLSGMLFRVGVDVVVLDKVLSGLDSRAAEHRRGIYIRCRVVLFPGIHVEGSVFSVEEVVA